MQAIPESSSGRMEANSVVAIHADETTPTAAPASTQLAQNDPELSNAQQKRVTIDLVRPNGSPSSGNDPIFAPSPATSSTAEDPPGPACSLEAEMDGPVTTPCVILVPDVGRLREGAQLVNTIQLGRKLGAGMQARVFDLVHNDGRPTGKVLKIAHQDLPHKALNAVWVSLEREWELGLQLRAALQEPDGRCPGFMRVCDGIVSGGRVGKAQFAGMVLEKLQGWEVYKRIEAPEFHNIHFIKEMLRQVFTALDKAERETGFFHADLGMRNIMEHYVELWEEEAQDLQQRSTELLPARPQGSSEGPRYELTPGAMPDGGDGRAPRYIADNNTSDGGQEQNRKKGAPQRVAVASVATADQDRNLPSTQPSPGRVRARPGFTCNVDGSRMPLGPKVEFKIIDYGSSYFSTTLAETTGGYRAREHYNNLRHLFEAKQVAFKSAARKKLIEIETSTAHDCGPGEERRWLMVPTRMRRRFKVRSTPKDALPVDSSRTSEQESSEQARSERLQSFTRQHMSSRASSGPVSPEQLRASLSTMEQRKNQGTASPDVVPQPPPAPRKGPIEILYRRFWRRKGDVFHLLLNLSIVLDDRVWPKNDEQDVNLFVSLVYHVTGIKMKASFASEDEPLAAGLFGRMGRLRGDTPVYGAKATEISWFRRMHIRLKAHLYPYNSGLTAGQALVTPFFDGQVETSPPRPVSLSTLFPRSSAVP